MSPPGPELLLRPLRLILSRLPTGAYIASYTRELEEEEEAVEWQGSSARHVLGRFLITDSKGGKVTDRKVLQGLVDSVSAAVVQRCSEMAAPDCSGCHSVKAQAVTLAASAAPAAAFSPPAAAASPRPRVTDDLQPDSGRDKRARLLHQEQQQLEAELMQGASSSEAELASSPSVAQAPATPYEAAAAAEAVAASPFAAAAHGAGQQSMLVEEEDECWAVDACGITARDIMSPLHFVSQDADLGQVRASPPPPCPPAWPWPWPWPTM
jgi:hypothetical protein